MNYVGIAVLGVENKLYDIALITKEYVTSVNRGISSEQVLQLVQSGIRPLNFSIKAGRITEDCGVFSRLQETNGVSPRIIIAEITSKGGRQLGFMLLDKSGRVYKVKKDDVVALCEQAKVRGVSYLQNGIYRVQDKVARIASYPNKPFIKIVVDTNKRRATKIKNTTDVMSHVDKQRNKENLKHEDKYSDLQRKELDMAKANGVNPLIIANPKLSPKQMRVIWASKKNGMASEYFANPKFSLEAMRFFADRLVDRKMFNECKPIMRPEFDVNQLTELYLGIYSGIDYMSYADPSLSSEDMYFKRVELESKFYKKPELDLGEVEPSEDLTQCASSFLRHRRK